jgi:hypothetical protein
MSKKSFLLGAIVSVLTLNAFADTTATVTSRNYVDAQDALKQDKITAGTTGNVVTYNGTQNGQAQFSERAIFDPETNFDYENNEVASGHEGDLVTAESIFPAVGNLYQSQTGPANTVVMYDDSGWIGSGPGVCDAEANADGECNDYDLVTRDLLERASNNQNTIVSTNRVCTEWVAGQSHTDANCLLWNLVTQEVYGRCHSNADCNGNRCDTNSGHCVIPE